MGSVIDDSRNAKNNHNQLKYMNNLNQLVISQSIWIESAFARANHHLRPPNNSPAPGSP